MVILRIKESTLYLDNELISLLILNLLEFTDHLLHKRCHGKYSEK